MSKVTACHACTKWRTSASGLAAIFGHVTIYVTAAILIHKMADFLPLFRQKSGSAAAAAGGGALRAPPNRGCYSTPPRACAGPPPRGALPPGPPRATSLTTCVPQTNGMLCRPLPGLCLRTNINQCTSEWLSLCCPSAERSHGRDSERPEGGCRR